MKKKCIICGRKTNRTYNLYGYKCVCSKHMHQILKYGKPLDTIQRTNSDLNDYYIVGNDVFFNLYNQKNEKIKEFIIDKEDIEKVKYHKWRISHGHVVTGLPSRGEQKDLSWIVLDLTQKDIQERNIVVDHRDGNGFNNRKSNLRICSQGENVLNKSFMSNNTSGFIGISFRKEKNRYDPEIRIGHARCHLGYTKAFEDAVYKRYYAEQLIFKEYANEQEQKRKFDFTKEIPVERKKELESIVEEKLRNKGLWQ